MPDRFRQPNLTDVAREALCLLVSYLTNADRADHSHTKDLFTFECRTGQSVYRQCLFFCVSVSFVWSPVLR